MACCNIVRQEYTCVPATEVLVFRDGTEATLGQVLVCKKPQSPIHLDEKPCKCVRVEHCHNINRASCRIKHAKIPNNYRLTYLDGATEFRASDYLCRTGGCCVLAKSTKVGRTHLHPKCHH
ncbi:unnamed protein product [Lymnaea stagnalis]|uniref:Uncharacterized protein n=1 Tax=Lymnaea stagnalis TaxID=6523 RepID=A0AAV2IMH8_LYMST